MARGLRKEGHSREMFLEENALTSNIDSDNDTPNY